MKKFLKRISGRIHISGPEFQLELTPEQEASPKQQGVVVPTTECAAIAIGNGARATGNGIAIGAGAVAEGSNIAIGAGAMGGRGRT